MNITLHIRLEDFPNSPHIVSTSGSAEDCLVWLSGFLADGVIVDSMKVMK